MKLLKVLLIFLFVVSCLSRGSQGHDNDLVEPDRGYDHTTLSASAAALFAQYLEDLRVYPDAVDNVNEDLLEDLRNLFENSPRVKSQASSGYNGVRPSKLHQETLETLQSIKSKVDAGFWLGIGGLVLSFEGGSVPWLILSIQQGWFSNRA